MGHAGIDRGDAEVRPRARARFRGALRVLHDGAIPRDDNAATYEIEITRDWEKYCKLSFTEHPERMSATFDSKYLSADELTRIYHDIYRRKRDQPRAGIVQIGR